MKHNKEIAKIWMKCPLCHVWFYTRDTTFSILHQNHLQLPVLILLVQLFLSMTILCIQTYTQTNALLERCDREFSIQISDTYRNTLAAFLQLQLVNSYTSIQIIWQIVSCIYCGVINTDVWMGLWKEVLWLDSECQIEEFNGTWNIRLSNEKLIFSSNGLPGQMWWLFNTENRLSFN